MKYEYMTAYLDRDEKGLNEYGADGWELVAVIPGGGDAMGWTRDFFIFKRVLESE